MRDSTKKTLLLLLGLIALTGCRSTDRYWSFPMIRYNEAWFVDCIPEDADKPEELLAGLFLTVTSPLWLPVVKLGVDVALLPITLPHDLVIHRLKRRRDRLLEEGGDRKDPPDRKGGAGG